jgi:hypothetical protein
MLGWEFFVKRQRDSHESPALAAWQAGLDGLDWLEALVSKGVANDLGGDGYPLRYLVPAGTMTALLAEGVPKGGGQLVLGDDYVQPPGWIGRTRIDMTRLQAIDPSEILLVEAWDQS